MVHIMCWPQGSIAATSMYTIANTTLGAHAQRGLQYLVCVSVCVSVCLSVVTGITPRFNTLLYLVCVSVSILVLQATTQLMSDTNSCSTTSARNRDRVTGIVKDHIARPSPSISGVSMRVRKYIPEAWPRPVVLDLAAARLFHLPLATSCPAQRGKADVLSGLPADAASLRETGSVDWYTPRGPVSHRIV